MVGRSALDTVDHGVLIAAGAHHAGPFHATFIATVASVNPMDRALDTLSRLASLALRNACDGLRVIAGVYDTSRGLNGYSCCLGSGSGHHVDVTASLPRWRLFTDLQCSVCITLE